MEVAIEKGLDSISLLGRKQSVNKQLTSDFRSQIIEYSFIEESKNYRNGIRKHGYVGDTRSGEFGAGMGKCSCWSEDGWKGWEDTSTKDARKECLYASW